MDFGTVPSVVYEGKTYLYLPYLYESETESAYRVHHLMEAGTLGSANLAIERFEKENGFRLAKEQRDAVEKSMKAGMMVITGGIGYRKDDTHSCNHHGGRAKWTGACSNGAYRKGSETSCDIKRA